MKNIFDTPQQAMESFRSGNEKSFMYIFRWLYPYLKYYCFLIIKDTMAAEDIVEECFIKLYNGRDGFTEANKVKSFMYACVRNESFDYLRLRKKTDSRMSGYYDFVDETEKDHLHTIINAEVAGYVFHLLNALPPKCKKVMKGLFVEEKSLSEIASEMKISINTVKNQRARGIMLIKKQYAL